MIEIKDLKKTYVMGKIEVPALRGVSARVEKGEFVAVMGPSGSGKSTLLHQAGLLDDPTSGKVILNGVDTSALSKEQKTKFRLTELGFVFQFYNLLPELNAIENVIIPKMLAGFGKDDCEPEGLKLLRTVGLEKRAGHIPSELSGGEQQRVAIARALINKPKILLADEPTANLDSKSAESVVDTFRELNKKTGQTILMVTHEPYLGKKADRIIYLKDGLVQRVSKR